MGVKVDLTGKKFGELTVIKEVPRPDNINGHDWSTKWICQCGCGEIITKTSSRITNTPNPMCRSCATKKKWEKKWVDLTGKVFGELTVIKLVDPPKNVKDQNSKYWKCKCSCGNTSIVKTSELNNGHCTRCWECAHYESNKHKRVDYTGQIFGELTVLEMIYPERKSNDKRTKCKCVCSCGNEIIRVMDSLFKSKNPSCGCKHYESILESCAIDINNKKFGKLLVLETIYDFENHTKPKVRCLCDCGNEVILKKNDVQSGHTLSCGCLQKETSSLARFKDLTGEVSDTGVEFLNISHQDKHGVRWWNCKCPHCGNIFQAIPAKLIGSRTASCGCIVESNLERITENILIEKNIKYVKQYSFDDCVHIHKLRFDFAVLNENGEVEFLIEADGKQHYEPIEWFGGEESFKSSQIRDNIKNEYCKEHNIPLLRLPYYLSKEEMESEIKKVI